MKNLKIIGLLVMAAALPMAVTSSAFAAPVLTSPAGTDYTGELDLSLKAGSTDKFEAGISRTCTTATFKGTITTNNTTHAAGAITTWSLGSGATPCTKTTSVLLPGKMTLGDKGELILSENQWTIFDLGVSCVYGGSTGTNVGTLTGGTPATMDINTTELPKISGGFLCASKGTWTATYIVTTPSGLLVT